MSVDFDPTGRLPVRLSKIVNVLKVKANCFGIHKLIQIANVTRVIMISFELHYLADFMFSVLMMKFLALLHR